MEQDHRRVKHRIRRMLGLKNFENLAVTISEIELVQKIREGQFPATSEENQLCCPKSQRLARRLISSTTPRIELTPCLTNLHQSAHVRVFAWRPDEVSDSRSGEV